MTKTQKENVYVALVVVALLVILWFLHRSTTGTASTGTTAGTTDPTSDNAPYYLTFNQPSPGATNLGAPYYGPISFNNGCGCDPNGNNVTAAQVAATTGNNYALTGATESLIPGYITDQLMIE